MKKIRVVVIASFGLLLMSTPAFAVDASRDGELRGPVRAEVKRDIKQEFREEKKETTPGAKQAIKDKFARITGAIITATSGSSLTISTDGKTITVNILATTKLMRKFWGTATISEFSVGDMINVWGIWTDDTHTTVNAILIRNRSIQKRNGVFVGKVTSLTSTGWVLDTFNRGAQTVTVSSTTKFTDVAGKLITQADVVTGNRVKVRGLWNSKLSTITEVTVVKDYSLPVRPAAKVATSSASE